ncbi:hypothetical protein HY373_01495 [Candidatus Berkelbacteria bacterium]|nr:hypothetical protein [Candidatus Berkelbacteria bacterium]MBI2588412.1 hypothetical protein [Candidatus Berkelbacteria bacterium]MBI4029834.1 hypothetical protein [Candidatus Berkelbacteria bacterium]
MSTLVGRWAFVIGLIISILAGFVDVSGVTLFLFILGLVVGFLNVSEQESTPFLVAVITLLLVGSVGLQGGQAEATGTLAKIITTFVSFVAAAGLVVAVKQALSVVKTSNK